MLLLFFSLIVNLVYFTTKLKPSWTNVPIKDEVKFSEYDWVFSYHFWYFKDMIKPDKASYGIVKLKIYLKWFIYTFTQFLLWSMYDELFVLEPILELGSEPLHGFNPNGAPLHRYSSSIINSPLTNSTNNSIHNL